MANYQELLMHLSAKFEEVDGYHFYKEIFPDNEPSGALYDDFSHPNAIYLYQDERDTGTKRRLRRRIMLDDTWEMDYVDYVEGNPMTLCSGLSYRRRANRLENAQRMHALIFDLDGVGDHEIRNLFLRFDQNPAWIRTLPQPTYLVASGGGLHLYYVFEEPIDLYPNIKLQLKALKHDLTFRIWEYKSTSQRKEIQYQSINQGFRMVGSCNMKYDPPATVRAFRTGGKVTLDYINQYVPERSRVDLTRPFRPSKMTLPEAREKYPDWYQRVIVEKQRSLKKWDIAGKVHGENPYALYDWWIRQAEDVKGGHRYYFLMCMAVYACKCDVPRKKLKADMKDVFHVLEKIDHDNPLTEVDVKDAFEAYSREYYNFTLADIEKLTDIRVERNKRNGQKQAWHLEDMRSKKFNMKRRGQPFKNPEGRPKGSGTAEQKVRDWRRQHPDGTKKQCKDDTGLSYPTIRKWWNSVDAPVWQENGHIVVNMRGGKSLGEILEQLEHEVSMLAGEEDYGKV